MKTHILLGGLTIGNRRTSDILNLGESNFLPLRNVKITPADGKQEARTSDFAYVNKDDIAFVDLMKMPIRGQVHL